MKISVGNIFESKAKTLVNTINCVGIMGKGIALEFKQKYPYMYKEYIALCNRKAIKPGEPYLYADLMSTSIINFPTKDHWKSPSKLSYIINGLQWFKDNYDKLGIVSIAFPPLGCGNGGLSWDIVGPIMYENLVNLPIEIEIYAPYGTASDKLTSAFLSKNYIHSTSDILGNKNIKFNDKWLLILYVVKKLSENRYVLNVGRTIFQKICYVLNSEGVNIGAVFTKGSYGPYSPQIKNIIMVLSNANLIIEKQLGQMISVEITNKFSFDKNKYSIQELDAVEKTIDLFSRIKSTEQAEIIATVLFSYELIKKENDKIMDKDIFNFVLNWKPKWKINNETIINSTIQNLAMLDWINVTPSKEMIESSYV